MLQAMKSADDMEDQVEDLIEKGRLRRAETILKRMLAGNSKCLAAHFHLARVYRRTRQFECALKHAHRTLRIDPCAKNACLNLGLIYECMGRDRLAVSYYKKELSRNPFSAETLFNIGRLYHDKRRWLATSTYLQRCFNTGFEFELEDTVYKLSTCYYMRSDLDSYISLFRRYLEIVSASSWAAANLGYALFAAKDYKRAIGVHHVI